MFCQFGRVAVRGAALSRLRPCLCLLPARQILGAINQPSISARSLVRGFSSGNESISQGLQKRHCATKSTGKDSELATEGSSSSSSSKDTEDSRPTAPTAGSSTNGGAGGLDEDLDEKEQRQASAQTYREIVTTWIASREADLRGLAAESSLALRDFLADPSVTIFGKELALSKLKDIANLEFDLSKFRGSFESVANLTAWYSPRQQQEQAEQAEQEMPPPEAWTKEDGKHPAITAFENGELSFGFSAGGLLFSYYIGVVFALHDLGIITRETKIGGASAGSLIAACYHSGLSQELITSACFELAKDCRTNGTRGRLGLVVREFLEKLLPEDIHERCKNRAFVAITRVWPRPTPELISDFHSRDDLIQALLTSCHVPWWLDSRPWTTFRGSASYDGGLTNFIPIPPSEHGVQVCCFPSKQITRVYDIQISPDSFTDWEHGMTQMVAWAFEPADEQMLEQFVEKGRADAKAWADACGLLELVTPAGEKAYEEDGGGKQTSRMEPTVGTAAASA
mmetsp:Transcript_6088/g.17432  ORF Transcript_6088/g.17432 Transcript_6088/m.17432 type:complete len:512 (+) Transcript_6088:157-1692(+)